MNSMNATERTAQKSKFSFKALMNNHEFTVFLVLILMVAVFSLATERFMTTANLLTILNLSSLLFIMAVGEMLVVIGGGIDLSIANLMALGGIVCTSMIRDGFHPIIAILATLAVGALVGIINGVMTAKVGIIPFIVTIAMQLICHGVAYTWTGGYPINFGLPKAFTFLGQGKFLGIPFLVVISVIIYIIFFLLLHKSKYGAHLYAVGGNEEASRLSGINVVGVKIISFVISGLLGAFAGILMAARLGSGQPTAGSTYLNYVIGGAFLGGTSPSGGVGKIYGTLIGVLIFQTISNGLTHLQVNTYAQEIVRGAIILVALTINAFRDRKLAR